MPLIYALEPHDHASFPPESLERLAATYTEHFPALKEGEFVIDVGLLSNQEMQELNRETRQKDTPTDVLSFPLFESLSDIRSMGDSETLIGSIVIAPAVATVQGSTLLDLLHHGTMHILGWDHETDIEDWRKTEHNVVETATHHALTLIGIPEDL